MTLTKLVLAASCVVLSTLPSFGLNLRCSVPTSKASLGYIANDFAIQHEDGAGQAKVADGIIMEVFGAPIEAKVTEDTLKKLVLSWTVPVKDSTGETFNARYRATFFRETGKMIVRATLGTYSNNLEERGTCGQG